MNVNAELERIAKRAERDPTKVPPYAVDVLRTALGRSGVGGHGAGYFVGSLAHRLGYRGGHPTPPGALGAGEATFVEARVDELHEWARLEVLRCEGRRRDAADLERAAAAHHADAIR